MRANAWRLATCVEAVAAPCAGTARTRAARHAAPLIKPAGTRCFISAPFIIVPDAAGGHQLFHSSSLYHGTRRDRGLGLLAAHVSAADLLTGRTSRDLAQLVGSQLHDMFETKYQFALRDPTA